jgi:hypothetical protein
MKRALVKIFLAASAAATVTMGAAGVASAAPVATHHQAQTRTVIAASNEAMVTARSAGVHTIVIPAGATIQLQPDGLACISNPISACGYVFSAAFTQTIYNTVIDAGIGAAATACANFLNAHGAGYLSFACNAVATWVKGQLNPQGACLFVGAAGTTPIAVYTRDFCA